jgi:hypothetical protein
MGTSSEQLLELYADRGRTVVTLGLGGWQVPYARGHVIHLQDHPAERDVVSAVRAAPGVEGFVWRGGFRGRELLDHPRTRETT